MKTTLQCTFIWSCYALYNIDGLDEMVNTHKHGGRGALVSQKFGSFVSSPAPLKVVIRFCFLICILQQIGRGGGAAAAATGLNYRQGHLLMKKK